MIAVLRLYPSVPVNTRTAIKTTVLPTGGGPDRKSPVLIPKGSAVAHSVYSMHRRPDLYGMDVEIFRLERWDEDMPMYDNLTNAKWGYLLFNGGLRICLGSMNATPTHFHANVNNRCANVPQSGFCPCRSRVHYCPAGTAISDYPPALY